MNTTFFSVIYPAVEPFLPDFFESLEAQTTSDFSIVLVNDGVADVDQFLKGFEPSRVSILEPGTSPVENRMIGIRHALKSGAEYLVFGDSDDFFSANRLEKSVDLLSAGWDIVANDLTAVDSDGNVLDANYLSRRVEDGAEIDLPFILDKNLFGLSNTAVRTSILNGISVPEGLVAVDWYLFSSLLLRNYRAVFTGRTNTYYRQHGANTVGVGGELTATSVMSQLDTKTRHCRAMREAYGVNVADDAAYAKTKNLLEGHPDLVAEYTKMLRQNSKKDPLWWENILPWGKKYEVKNN